jgi:nitrate/nitrite transport system permease protein
VPIGRRMKLPNLAGVTLFHRLIGFGWLVPLTRIAAGEEPKVQIRELWHQLGIPLIAILAFLLAWAQIAPTIQTSLGAVPADHLRERDKADAFYERQDERNAQLARDGRTDKIKWRDFTGKPTYLDQIVTSLKTVFTGFVLASLIAIPVGVVCGLSPAMNAALNPLIQIFKPVSPLAWLPLVTMVVSAVYTTPDPAFDKSFLNSALTVMLCSLWPALINTTLGVASMDKDLLNVGKVLQLNWRTQVAKLVLPSALPLIFTGLRLSLGVGWMVLIAAEMLAQNPGLGKFVWDEFQNGSSDSLARIMVAVFTIGMIGFLLDRVMYALQSMVTHNDAR